ncbi:MAG: amidase [Acidimicrobiia bacterium]|nr:amidase [Acidimicrobiia bacterium]MBT8193706.1 amidase [Acidimicrobiia bacterium]NNF87814.1 amidase [Acidimicrobiia bacterium]NNL13055.1 amidase [Acidimicrobiia bacterium]NNL97734.1 amidase [Acidimicrobiia bacterium]
MFDPFLSAAEQIELVRIRAVTVRELVTAYLDRSEAARDELNAYTLIDRQEALLRAELIDRRLFAGDDVGPLAGVTVALKDIIDQKGLPTTAGSSFYRHVGNHSATVVERLEAAGAIVIGRTGLHEFAFGFSSENHWFGPVRNPWDPSTSPGGSSGGSAAAVAAGLSAVAIGTDTGGSVRVPAAVCGTVGLKVTHGRVPLTGVFPLAPSLDTVGPLARTVGDASLVYAAMAGHDPSDPYSLIEPVKAPSPDAGIDGLVVGVPHPWVDQQVDPALRAAFDAALARLAGLGAEIRHLEDEFVQPPGMINEAAYSEVAVVHGKWFPSRADEYSPEVADRLGPAMAVTVAASVAAKQWRLDLREHTFDLFRECDVLVTPAVAGNRKEIGSDTVVVDGTEMGYRRAFATFSALVNHAGHPALVVPIHEHGDPPPSLQLIGPDWSEHRLLEIGIALERAGVVRFRPPPGRE